MKPVYDHEKALLLVLKDRDHPAEAFEALLAHPDVTAYHLPPPWASELGGVDLLAAMPDLETVTLERLEPILDVLIRLHSRERLEALCAELWRETSEQVRSFFLSRSLGATLAGIFRLGPKTKDLPPPADFVQGQIYTHKFEMQYRLHRGEGEPSVVAPAEEGSLVLYPFDVANAGARKETGLQEGTGPILEAFAYQAGRQRHERVLRDVAAKRGWQVLDSPD